MKLKNIFLKGKMNKDLDERLVPQDELIHAENIQIAKSDGTDVGAVENMLGNRKLTNIDYGTNPECVGGLADESTGLLYWLVASDAGGFLMEHNFRTGTTTTVLKDTRAEDENVLKLSKDHLITGINLVVDTDNDRNLLLYTDDLNQPRCINIGRAKSYGENGFDEDDILLIKKPPIDAPEIVMFEDNETDENNLRERFVAFSYRYIYLDGETSALSPFTEYAFKPKEFQFDFATHSNESMINDFREVEVSFNTGSKRVKEIEVFFKESGSNNVYFVEKFNKRKKGWSDDTMESTLFSNNKVTRVLPEDELYRLYDNVPIRAKAQDMTDKELVFGNYVDNYNLTRDDVEISIDLNLKKNSKPISLGTPTDSVKSNRDYEAAVVYLDAHGRMTTPLTSEGNTIYVPPKDCVNANSLDLEINHKAPDFAKYFRVFIKQSKEDYDTVVNSSFHQDGVYVWLKVGPNDLDKFKEGDYLIVKSDTRGVVDQYVETRVIEIKEQEKNFLVPESKKESVGDAIMQQSGLYYKLKPEGFSIDAADFEQYHWEVFDSTHERSLFYLSNYIDKPVYYGNLGLDDLSVSGEYTKSDEDIRYEVEIDTTGTVDTFRWSDDGGLSFTREVPITGGVQSLSNGVSIKFNSTTGHSKSDRWIIPAKGYRANGIGTDTNSKAFLVIKSVDGEEIYGGATITIKVWEEKESDASFEQTYTSSRDYANLEEWFYGEGIDQDWEGQFHGYWFRRGITNDPETSTRGKFVQNPEGEVCLIIRSSGTKNNGWDGNAKMHGRLDILQSRIMLMFETKEQPVTSEIFYELPGTYRVFGEGLHSGDINQTESSPAKISLPFKNCFAWGNGFESYKIKDSITGRSMKIDTRPHAQIEDYRQQHRVASMTYSGVYEQSVQYNSLNKFNLYLANYKDLDDAYGSIQKLFSRDANMLVFQENKVGQVLVRKNVLYGADGAENVQQSNEVLGQYLPYSGEYGISKSPESLVTHDTFVGWTDTNRGKVLKLGGKGIFPISDWGMRSWFRDYFKTDTNFRNIAGYDPHTDKMILSVSPKEKYVLTTVECGQEIVRFEQTDPYSYRFNLSEGTESINLIGNATGIIIINSTTHNVDGDFDINVPVTTDYALITITPTDGTYNVKHVCNVPVVVEPEPEPPIVEDRYFVYMAISCSMSATVTISSPEALDPTKYDGKVVVIDGKGYKIIDADNYNTSSVTKPLHLTGGNNTKVYPSCASLLPPEEEESNLFAHSLSRGFSSEDACTRYSPSTYYMDSSFTAGTKIFLDKDGKKLAPAGFYSDTAHVREWNGVNFTSFNSRCGR